MKNNNIAAIVAAEIANSCRLRPRLVQLTPRAFYLLARTRNISSSPRRSIAISAIQRAEPVTPTATKATPTHEQHKRPETVVSKDASDTRRDGPMSEAEAERDKTETHWIDFRRKSFINLMRTVPHPVAVITARKQDIDDDVPGTLAATVSSFNTVSLDPDLIVSFNLKSSSSTYQTIVESKHFTVTFPQMNSAGADLVNSFTKGNDPSPFLENDTSRPAPKPFQWIDRESGVLPDMIYPPTVALAELEDTHQSGFAFAFMCEYQTSTFIGDHVIVTGRLTQTPIKTASSGWGRSHDRTPFVEKHVTLTHAHGTYSSADIGPGFTNILKLDEALDARHANASEAKIKVSLCRQRLRLLALAQLKQQGVNTAKLQDKHGKTMIPLIEKVAAMKPELLNEYEQYYGQRLVYWEIKARQEAHQRLTSTQEEASPDVNDIELHTYENLTGHEKLFIRNKMLLSQDDLDEEIALYQMRLSKLKIQAQEDPSTQAFDDDPESAGEHSPEEMSPSPNSNSEEETVPRDKQLVQYFRKRVYLLQQAKIKKVESSSTKDPIDEKLQTGKEPGALKRFLGVQRSETLYGLKTKYRRYQYQIIEARLALIGLEELPSRHKDVKTLKDRIEYFTPRLEIVERCIKDRAKSSTARDLLAEHFQPPPMRIPDDDGKMVNVKNKNLERKLIRTIPTQDPPPVRFTNKLAGLETQAGDSADQLDYLPEDEPLEAGKPTRAEGHERTRQAVRAAAKKMPVGIDPGLLTRKAALPEPTPEEQEEQEIRQMEQRQKDLMRRNANQVRDYLVLQDPDDEDGDGPSPNDFIDVRKIREERLRQEAEEKAKGS